MNKDGFVGTEVNEKPPWHPETSSRYEFVFYLLRKVFEKVKLDDKAPFSSIYTAGQVSWYGKVLALTF